MSAERPILFTGPMVRAILEGRKTQTRRVVKPQPSASFLEPYRCPDWRWNWVVKESGHGSGDPFPTPYGAPGDRLWVRETWAVQAGHPERGDDLTLYAADGAPLPSSVLRWRPSIHMPRARSRLMLTITDVRVERLQDISESDARAEGCPFDHNGKGYDPPANDVWQGYGRSSFCSLWWKIHGAASWDANPWVWVIGFTRADA